MKKDFLAKKDLLKEYGIKKLRKDHDKIFEILEGKSLLDIVRIARDITEIIKKYGLTLTHKSGLFSTSHCREYSNQEMNITSGYSFYGGENDVIIYASGPRKNSKFIKLKSEIESYVKNRIEHQEKFGGLEKKTLVFLLFSAVGIALTLPSLTSTGYAISSLTQTSQGMFGIIFFIAGLVGMFLLFKKK